MSDWRPLHVREGRGGNWEGPFEGVPEWLFGPLATWLDHRYPLYTRASQRYEAVGEYQRLAMALRISLDDDTRPKAALVHQRRFIAMARAQPDLLLAAADHWLSIADFPPYPPTNLNATAELESVLRRAGSVYTVMPGDPPYLSRVVGQEQQSSAIATTGRGSNASAHISAAWRAAYGRDPHPTTAYRESVRAVEAASIAVVSPRHSRATLGTVLGELRANPGRIALRIELGRPELAAEAVTAMLALLWEGQQDRHGTPDADAPLSVTLEQAQDATRLAVLLVEWFESGSITYGGG